MNTKLKKTAKQRTITFSLLSIFFILLIQLAGAQNRPVYYEVSGVILDATDGKPLEGVNIVLINDKDNTQQLGTITNEKGSFNLHVPVQGLYHLKVSFVGYKSIEQDITVTRKSLNLDKIKMEQATIKLKDVLVEAKPNPVEQKGDTTQYNAGSFKTHPDATAEELVTKMPGISVENGTVKAHGEDVKKVLVDGKEFFGDDPTVALRNLPAEVIDKIQVYNQLSDQSQFTGFNDGQTQKTLNIVTKSDKRNGTFGKMYAGYGSNERYSLGATIHRFHNQRRLSLIGLSNNINQQNFSSQDLLGVSSGNGGGGQGGRGGAGGGGGIGGGGGGNSASNFLVGQQSGMNTTNSIGLNYTDEWGKKVKITGSYFFNKSNNTTNSLTEQQYFISNNTYTESNRVNSINYNHRFNLRFEYTIDSANSLLITPRLNLQNYNSGSLLSALTASPESQLTQVYTDYNSKNNGYTFTNEILFRHKFQKRGRTFSVAITTNFNDKNGQNKQYSENQYFTTDSSAIINQLSDTRSDGSTLGARFSYTEPIGQKSILEFNYNPSYTRSNSTKETNAFNEITKTYSIQDTSLSNNFKNTTWTQSGGMSYRLRGAKYNFSVGTNYQRVELNSSELFPTDLKVNKTFTNLMPTAMLEYRFTKSTNLRVFYRTSTNTPSISQLQNVINNSNTVLLTTGNPNLKQEYAHSIMLHYGKVNTGTMQNMFVFANATYTTNYIATSTFTASTDTLLAEGILLSQGAQLSRPVNMASSWNVRSFFVYGLPVELLKSNFNITTGITYQSTPGLIIRNDNQYINHANTYGLNSGVTLSSNISQKVDFRVSYSATYTIVNNTVQSTQNSNYFYQVSSVKLNWLPWKGLVFNTDVNHSLYSGLSSGYNQSFLLWNAAIGYKFLKNNAGELKLSVFDLLGQNTSISRTVTETYIQDKQTQVLQRYFMLTFTYNLRSFPGVQNRRVGPPMDGMGPPPGAGPGGPGASPFN